MQNSLERIFEGMATSLREAVLPEVEDPYARAQVAAAIELVGNVATRVEWRADHLREEIERIRQVLAAAPSRVPVLDERLPLETAALVELRDRHREALGELAEDGSEDVAAQLRRFLSWQLEHELALLRTGMYK
ncbi:MAG: hypothetical protein FJW96_01345 [Actinobacteria bacterium]|nr:hypothetical protein [Actinomycetota bacterium]